MISPLISKHYIGNLCAAAGRGPCAAATVGWEDPGHCACSRLGIRTEIFVDWGGDMKENKSRDVFFDCDNPDSHRLSDPASHDLATVSVSFSMVPRIPLLSSCTTCVFGAFRRVERSMDKLTGKYKGHDV